MFNSPGAGQNDWKYCEKCHGLTYDGGGVSAKACPEGGVHDLRNHANYTLMTYRDDI